MPKTLKWIVVIWIVDLITEMFFTYVFVFPSVQVGEKLFNTDRWVPPSGWELYYLRPSEDSNKNKFGFLGPL